MIVNLFTDAPGTLQTEALVLFVRDGQRPRYIKELEQQIPPLALASFKAKFGETLLAFPAKGTVKRILLVGLGDSATDRDPVEVFRRALGIGMKFLTKQGVLDVAVYIGAIFDESFDDRFDAIIREAIVISLIAPYGYEKHRSKKEDSTELRSFTWVAPLARTKEKLATLLKEACVIADSVRIARDLVNAPSNVMTPAALARAAKQLVESQPTLSCTVFDQKKLASAGFGGILAAAQGSDAEPQLITLEYLPAGQAGKSEQVKTKKTVVLVGKGVTFDSGGINLKPERGMNEMHMDMAGGAAVLATVYAAAALQLPIHVVGVVPAVANMPSGTASKPGDIITSKSGLTIEVANTDAEGRIILADALTHAAAFKPDLIIDCATLTGAALVALGEERAALLGNNQKLIDSVLDVGRQTGELLWQLPIDDDYREHVKSDSADVKNLGKKGNAGVIAGAAFLEKFVSKDTPWAHIDLAGPAMRSEPGAYQPKGGTGWGVRLLTAFLEKESQ